MVREPSDETARRLRHVSGVQPTGRIHLGNYFGAVRQHLAAAAAASPGSSDALFFIADLHALTTIADANEMRRNVAEVAATYLALGLDTERAVFFRQSDVPEVTELGWLLATSTGMGLLERAHAYKDKMARGLGSSVGLFTYPLLMAADIVIHDADVVPVGQDQVQHVEMARDMVGHFNARWGASGRPVLRRPEWRLSRAARVPGTDGEKMSKSYANTIWIFEEGEGLEKTARAIVTDGRAPDEPKDPDSVVPYRILEPFLTEEEARRWRERIEAGGPEGPGYAEIKREIVARMDSRFGEARARYRAFMPGGSRHAEVEDVLLGGAARARSIARSVLARCYEATGMPNAAARLRAP